jgi:photosystem II Psb27 protein
MLSAITLSLSLLAPVQRAVLPQHVRASPADVSMSFSGQTGRRGVLAGFAAAAVGIAPVFADVSDEQYKLKKDYVVDAKNMLQNMRAATDLQRGNPDMVRSHLFACSLPPSRPPPSPGHSSRRTCSSQPVPPRPLTAACLGIAQENIVKSTRSEMNDFVAFYRRQPKISGMPSFSTMYTAINTLSGHYASYGNKYPVPEKRKTRLAQQYKEIERALARGK